MKGVICLVGTTSEDAVKVRGRLFPATVRETSSRPNRHLCHRGSHNDDDHGCKIITLPGHYPLAVKKPSEAAAGAFHSAFHDSVQGGEAAPAATRAPLGDFHQGYLRHRAPTQNSPRPKTVNQLTIDTIGYILSQMLATCQRGDERQTAISINAGHREWSWC
jgi:hypothetical protein